MYKILLVTDRPEVLDAFAGVNTWETLGFERLASAIRRRVRSPA